MNETGAACSPLSDMGATAGRGFSVPAGTLWPRHTGEPAKVLPEQGALPFHGGIRWRQFPDYRFQRIRPPSDLADRAGAGSALQRRGGFPRAVDFGWRPRCASASRSRKAFLSGLAT
jgi:hypothetical protein